MSEPQYTCALWYWRHHAVTYYLAENEAEAAAVGSSLLDHDDGLPLGVQFADGRTIRRDDWAAFDAALYQRERARKDIEARLAAQPPEPPPRKVLDPFDGRALMIDADEPAWLGKQPPAPTEGQQQ